MSLETLFDSDYFSESTRDLKLVSLLVERYGDEKPFRGLTIVFGHYLAANSLGTLRALHRGAAHVVICDPFRTKVAARVTSQLAKYDIEVWPVQQGVKRGELFFDVNASLGRQRTPAGAAEITRTGILHYQGIPCPVISADDSQSKRIEGYFGIGDGFLRAWRQFFPNRALEGQLIVQFGYGKIGRGVASRARLAGADILVVEASGQAGALAQTEGFETTAIADRDEVQKALRRADIVVAVTGIPGGVGRSVPAQWLRHNRPVLVNLGAEDEYGPEMSEDEVLGGKAFPLNFHLQQPTLNRYIDPSFAAHLLAMESLVQSDGEYPVGIHPLQHEYDGWVLRTWDLMWPDEDVSRVLTDPATQKDG